MVFFLILFAASFLSLCKPEDANCIKKSSQDLFPAFLAGISEITDPLFIKYIDLSFPNLKLRLRDVFIAGLREALLKSIRFNDSKTNVTLKLLSTLKLEGTYDMAGELLFLPIEGKGPVHIELRSIEISANLGAKQYFTKDRKLHWNFAYKDHNFILKSRSVVEFDNLFNGDATTASLSKEILANSGNEIINEVGDPIVKAVIEGLLKSVNSICGKISLEELIYLSTIVGHN